DAEEPLTGVNVLTGLVHEQFFDVALRSHGDDRQSAFIVHDLADGPHRPHNHALLDSLGANAAALNFVEAYLDDVASVLILAFIDWDVIHSHPVLLWDRRSIGKAHRVAVVADFSRAAFAWSRFR